MPGLRGTRQPFRPHLPELLGVLNLPNPVAAAAALAAAVLLGGLIGCWAYSSCAPARRRRYAGRAGNTSSDPAADTTEGYGWIVQAMAECDEEAKLRTDTMHFLIVPVTSTGMSLPGWSPSPITSVGAAVLLLNSKRRLDRSAQPSAGALSATADLRHFRSGERYHPQMEAGGRRDRPQDARHRLGHPQAGPRDFPTLPGRSHGDRSSTSARGRAIG